MKIDRLPPLAGSTKQVKWASTIRLAKIISAMRVRPDLVPMLGRIVDATWFIANKDSPLAEIKPPAPHQMVGWAAEAPPPEDRIPEDRP